MSCYRMAALCVGGREAAAGRAKAGQAQEEGAIRCARDDRGPDHRQELLGQVVVQQSRTLQRLCEPACRAAGPMSATARSSTCKSPRARSPRWSAAPISTRSRSPSRRSRRRDGNPSAGIAQERSIRWSSCCRAAWPRASWTGSAGRATACFRRPRRSSCPAAVRTGPTCASMLRRRSTGSAPGSTKALQLLFVLRGVDENELLAGAGRGSFATKAAPSAAKVLDDSDVAALFGLEMAETASSDIPTAPMRPKRSKSVKASTPSTKTKTPPAKQDKSPRTSRCKPEPKWVTLVRARKRRAQRRRDRAA